MYSSCGWLVPLIKSLYHCGIPTTVTVRRSTEIWLRCGLVLDVGVFWRHYVIYIVLVHVRDQSCLPLAGDQQACVRAWLRVHAWRVGNQLTRIHHNHLTWKPVYGPAMSHVFAMSASLRHSVSDNIHCTSIYILISRLLRRRLRFLPSILKINFPYSHCLC